MGEIRQRFDGCSWRRATGNADGGGFGGGPQDGGGSEFGPSAQGSGPPSFDIVAFWQSALPIRQAFVRLKFGAKADKSPKPGDAAKALGEVTSLSSRRTGGIKPFQIEVGKPGKTMDVLFAFPRSMPFTVEDKEIELTTKLNTSTLKYKFKLKEMVLNKTLEM